MKQLFTLLTLLLVAFNFNAQDFDNLSPEGIEDFFLLENQPNHSAIQVDLRSPFRLDSAYFYPLPDDVLEQKRFYTYNDLGSLLSFYTLRLNTSNNVWENYRKVEYIRDANDNITQNTNFVADQNTFDWVPDYKFNYTIDANGNYIESLLSNWNTTSSTFVNNLKWEHNFDADNILIDEYKYNWNVNNSDWDNSQYTEFTYDADGKLLEEVTQVWLLNVYNNYIKITYEYDMDNNLIRKTYLNWDSVYLIWDNFYKLEFINIDDVLVAQYRFLWAELPNGFDWSNNTLTQFSHDGNGNITQALYSEYNFDNEMWEGNRRWLYFFSDFDTTTETPENTNLTCYLQNPIRTGEIINCQDLDWSKNYNLMLFDVSGKVLLEKNFQGDVEFELPSFLKSGMYFMNVMEEGKLVLKEKMVVID